MKTLLFLLILCFIGCKEKGANNTSDQAQISDTTSEKKEIVDEDDYVDVTDLYLVSYNTKITTNTLEDNSKFGDYTRSRFSIYLNVSQPFIYIDYYKGSIEDEYRVKLEIDFIVKRIDDVDYLEIEILNSQTIDLPDHCTPQTHYDVYYIDINCNPVNLPFTKLSYIISDTNFIKHGNDLHLAGKEFAQ